MIWKKPLIIFYKGYKVTIQKCKRSRQIFERTNAINKTRIQEDFNIGVNEMMNPFTGHLFMLTIEPSKNLKVKLIWVHE